MTDETSERIAVEAKSISVGACDFCPAVHINLLDSHGLVFATASVPLEHCEPLIAQIRAEMKSLSEQQRAPGGRQ